jgi:hypothetical protein
LPTFVDGGVFDDSCSNREFLMWNLKVVLICIFFMARDGEHFFVCILAIWISSFAKFLFSSFAHFFIVLLIWGEFSFLSFLYMLDISPLSDV